jgi:hypothetical protein
MKSVNPDTWQTKSQVTPSAINGRMYFSKTKIYNVFMLRQCMAYVVAPANMGKALSHETSAAEINIAQLEDM